VFPAIGAGDRYAYVLWEKEVNPDQLFEKFPDSLFSSLKKQMLLGIVPGETVRQILEPLLSNFQELMLQLPPELQADFENVLRLYPDVADHFGISIKPPVVVSLRSIARYRPKPAPDASENGDDFDMAAESQQPFGPPKKSPAGSLVTEGQGFFTTDKGTPVYIELSTSEDDDCVRFEYQPHRLSIEIRICGVRAATLTPRSPMQKVPLDNLAHILRNGPREIEIKIVELS
jgi:hypothetical protein